MYRPCTEIERLRQEHTEKLAALATQGTTTHMDRHRRRIARELQDAGGDLSLTEESPYAVIEGLEGQDEVHRIREACRMILEEAERTINEADRSMQHRMQNSQSIIGQLHALLAENKVAIPNHLAKLVKPGPWSDQENVSPAAAAVEPHQLHLAEARLDRQAETLFEALDVNGDGLIERQEWERAKAAWQEVLGAEPLQEVLGAGSLGANLPGYREITDPEAAAKVKRPKPAAQPQGELCEFHKALGDDEGEADPGLAVGVGSNSSILGPTRVSDVAICRGCKLLHVVCECKDPIAEARKKRAGLNG